MYSADTGHFYSNHEKYLHDMICKHRSEYDYINNKLHELNSDHPKYRQWTDLLRHKREKANESKKKLLNLLSNKIKQNELTDGKDHIRTLRENDLHDHHVISVFESSLTRMIGIEKDELTDALLLVQVYYFDIFKDLSFYGFLYKGEKYKYFTSSAGQIRKKKAVFIKESVWNKTEKSIMCGLTIDKINAKGGNNVNKHLACLTRCTAPADYLRRIISNLRSRD